MFLTQKIDGNFLASMMLLEQNNCGIDEKSYDLLSNPHFLPLYPLISDMVSFDTYYWTCEGNALPLRKIHNESATEY